MKACYGEACREIATQPELIAASRSTSVELVIVTPRDRAGQRLVTAVAAIRASRRSAPVYVYIDRSDDGIRELIPLAHAGARGMILPNADDDPVSLRKLLERGRLRHVVETVTLAAQHVVATRQLPLVLQSLEQLGAPVSAAAFARQLRVSRRTLSAWAAKAGSRGVRSLMSKCRVLAAIEMLRCTDRTIEHIAHELRFGSSAHLHNTIRRYTGLRPRQAAQYDAEYWAARFFGGPSVHHNGRSMAHQHLPPAETVVPRAEWPPGPNDATLSPTIQAPA